MSTGKRLKQAIHLFLKELAANPPAVFQDRQASPPPATEPGIVMNNQLLAGKNVLITGAGRNIGRSIALEMAKQGARIFFTDIDAEGAADLSRALQESDTLCRGFIFDVAKPEENEALMRKLEDAGVGIDILVNNVGISSQVSPTSLFDRQEWQKVFDTNLFGPMHLTRLVTQKMIASQKRASILFITSIHQWAVKGDASYSASKAALGMVIKELALELARDGIRVNGIAPGWVEEDAQGNPVEYKNNPLHLTSIPPAFIGRAAVYLSADYFSEYITGTILKIDDGVSLLNFMHRE